MLFVVQFLDQQIKTSTEKTWQKHAWKADVHMLTLLCFVVKNPSLKTYCSQFWTFPALPSHSPSRAVPMDHSFFHNMQATRHMSIHLGVSPYLQNLCGYGGKVPLRSRTHIEICFCPSAHKNMHYDSLSTDTTCSSTG